MISDTYSAPLISDGHIRGVSPVNEAPLDPVACTPLSELPSIVANARAAGDQHARRTVYERADLLRKFATALMLRGDELVSVLANECGKIEVETRMAEILPIADLAGFWCEEGPEHLRATEPDIDPITYPGKRAVIERAPRGVIALITPWNFPVAIPLRTIFPALLAGNSVILKPSEFSPRSAAIIGEVADKIFGAGLLTIVQGGGDIGSALIASGVQAVVFTGSVATGRKVAHAAADALIPVSLELGGKDAAIVLDDAPLERTAQGIVWGAFANTGQNCAAIERVYATPGIAPKLRERITEITKTLVLGRDVGPLVTPAQFHTVQKHVSDALNAGAEALTGGSASSLGGLYFEPTILANAPASSSVVVEETFGPVLPILDVASEEAAIAAANDSRFGLTASVWTSDLARGERVARQLRAGVVMVNNHSFSGAIPALPWSGVGESGYGVTNSTHALDLLTRPRCVLIDTSKAKRELWWYPYTPALSEISKSLVALRGGAKIGRKIGAIRGLLGGMAKRWKVPT